MHSGGQILVKTLHFYGVERIFCVAGESFLPALDAFLDYPDIEVITCRQESGATFMAESYANLTGKPGVAFVTRGPGACNGSIGIHTAKQSSAPVLLFVGLIHSDDEGKEAFQEFDLPQMFGSLSKEVRVIKSAGDIQAQVQKAFETAESGRKGPVVLGLPEDILTAQAKEKPANLIALPTSKPSTKALQKLEKMLNASAKLLVIAGGHGWDDESCAALQNFAERAGLPVAASFRRQDIFNHSHIHYVGELGFGSNPDLLAYAKEADTILLLGARLSDVMSQGYTLFHPKQKLIHVYPDKAAIGKAYKTVLGIEAYPWDVLSALGENISGNWDEWRARGRALFESWTDIPAEGPTWNGADMTQIMGQLRDLLPTDAIITTDAGNFSGWCNRYLRYARPGRQLAPLSGAMGYGVPSAIAASLTYPDKVVAGFCGDGGFMMSGHELATAMHHGAKPIIIICNNNIFGTIRMHQQRDFPGRPSGTALTNPDFVKLAESYGAFAAHVSHADAFTDAWQAAVKSGKAAVIEITMDPAQISTSSVPV